MPQLPLINPRPARLSAMSGALRQIEERGIFSNGGPVVRRFEQDITARLFGGKGASLAVSNATVGLMLAIRHGAGARSGRGHLALVPAMTFAATAQAACWAGLVPLVYDIDPETWAGDAAIEEEALRRHGDRIAAIVPYATFGRTIDLDRYDWLARRHGVRVVVDAAASLGTLDASGLNFGAGAPMAVVYSMHATKSFATAEGGLVHSGDETLIETLRAMGNFGFRGGRAAELPGLNAKLSEHGGLLAAAKLADVDAISRHRAGLGACYRAALPDLVAQAPDVARQCFQFWSILLPPGVADRRAAIIDRLAADGIGGSHYFSPHLGQQSFFRQSALIEPTPVADDVARRILTLPITDTMTEADVQFVAERLMNAVDATATPSRKNPQTMKRSTIHSTVLIGGGPAGTAVLTAATRNNRLKQLAASGLVIVERGAGLGSGELGTYAIRSDTTAETFLSAVKDNVHPEIAAIMNHPAGVAVARSIDAQGAPLTDAGELVAVTAERLGTIVTANGGSLLTRHEAISARRQADGLWATKVRDAGGEDHEIVSRAIVVATGGYQCPDRVRQAPVAGSTLGELAGDRLVLGDAFLRVGGLDDVARRLAGVRAPRIAIVGGSTSAVAAAVLLFKASPGLPLGAGAVTLLHRRPLRPFYPSRAAAIEDGYTDFTDADICPVSGFVYRLGGFRLEARELVLRALAVGGRAPDPRLALFRLDERSRDDARAVLAQADIVIGATGYRPHALPLFDGDGQPIDLACDADRPGPLVDGNCRVIDARGDVVPHAFGIGLAAGFVPWGPLGGEPSFRGNANGLWLWQNDVGQMIVDQLLPSRQMAA